MSLHSSKTEHRKSPSGRKGAKHRAPSSASRIRRNPSHLEELETAAQTEVSEIPAELDAGPSPRPPASEDEDRVSVVEAGLSVDPEDLGRQFLRDATEQDNLESDVNLEREEGGLPLAEVTAEAMLTAREAALDVSEKSTPRLETERFAPEEASLSEIDLHSSSIREGSLFDQPTEQGTRSPRVDADEGGREGEPRDAREMAEAQALARLQRLTRPRALRRSRVASRAHSRR